MDLLVLGSRIGGILLLDLLLSGDNVLVIGAAAAGLARRERWYAIMIGGGAAMLLRILFTALASVILNISFIQTIGALILLYLAQKLLQERSQSEAEQQNGAASSEESSKQLASSRKNAFFSALLTILVADATMSLDNILAVGALANGEMLPLVVGLIGSITMLLLGSALVSVLVERLGWVLDIAALVLGWTSATMIHDDLVQIARTHHIEFVLALDQTALPWHLSWLLFILAIGTCGIVLFFDLFYRRRSAR
ncbi:MAG TPA: YjbE family putative metal transport protein [Ktedonobacteraceae bacterium]|jgi:YjbE family integral membrane protein|nr:YjbE family putative metal transport protein [Ktedonobacteraceae bacterium]